MLCQFQAGNKSPEFLLVCFLLSDILSFATESKFNFTSLMGRPKLSLNEGNIHRALSDWRAPKALQVFSVKLEVSLHYLLRNQGFTPHQIPLRWAQSWPAPHQPTKACKTSSWADSHQFPSVSSLLLLSGVTNTSQLPRLKGSKEQGHAFKQAAPALPLETNEIPSASSGRLGTSPRPL